MDYLNFANIIAVTVPFVVIVIDRVHKLSVTQFFCLYWESAECSVNVM